MSRDHEVSVRLDDDELAQLDEIRNGISRAAYLRSLILKPPDSSDVATRHEALGILTSMARDGKVTPAVELAKLLKGEDPPADPDNPLAEVDRIRERAGTNGN